MKTPATDSGRESRKDWKVVPFQDADLPAIGRFFKRHFPGPGHYGTMGLFHWRAVEHYLTRGIVNLVKDEGRIVSILSNTPKSLLVCGEESLVAEIGDAFTDPDYQRQGMQTLLTLQSIQDAWDRGMKGVYSTPDHQTPSLSAFINRANFLPLEGVEVKSLVLPLNIGPFLRLRGHWLAAQYVGSLHLTMAYLYFRLMKALHAAAGVEIVELPGLPEDWDRFWEKARKPYDAIFSRSRQALAWRFFQNPNRYTVYGAMEQGELAGYVVHRVSEDTGNRMLILADFLFLPGREAHLRALLLKVLEDALKAGVSHVYTWCSSKSPYYPFLRKYGFLKRNDILLIWVQNEFAARLRKTCKTWHFTISDSDNV
jgi:GNAT superfamily N-acetyltransferase